MQPAQKKRISLPGAQRGNSMRYQREQKNWLTPRSAPYKFHGPQIRSRMRKEPDIIVCREK
jgi:hypothetical protein